MLGSFSTQEVKEDVLVDPIVPSPPAPGGTSHVLPVQESSRLMHFWSVRLPRLLDPWASRLADSFSDGAWLAVWRFLGVAPLIWLTIGFLTPWLWPGMKNVYSESLFFLGLVIAISILSGAWGAMLMVGYILGDFSATLRYVAIHIHSKGFPATGWVAGHLIGYLLLSLLVIRIPQFARGLAEGGRPPAAPAPGIGMRALRYGVMCASLVFLWCESMILLIRPVFTWRHHLPTVDAVRPLQIKWPWLVAVAFVVAIARVVSEELLVQRGRLAPQVNELQLQRWEDKTRRGTLWHSMPAPVRAAVSAILITLILAGTYQEWTDAMAVFFVAIAIIVWRAGLLGKFPQGWTSLMEKIPVGLRMILAVVLGFLLSYAIQRPGWYEADSFRPVMIGALATVVLVHMLFPLSGAAKKTEAT